MKEKERHDVLWEDQRNGLTKEPIFWYSEYWMHRMYSEGVERGLLLRERNPPYRYKDDLGVERERGDCEYFYWTSIPCEAVPNSKSSNGVGHRLFAMRKKNEYSSVVDIRRDEHDMLRLYANRDFEFGDAIVFFPEFEERSGTFVLGGNYARVVYGKDAANAYLTRNRVLRSMSQIKKGDEIVRCVGEDELTEYLENVDQVVVSLDNMTIGRIGSEFLTVGSGRFVHFPNDRMQIIRKRSHIVLFC